jgi:dienelactone hydrolase
MRRLFSSLTAALAVAASSLIAAPAQAAVMLTVPATAATPAIPIYLARPKGDGPFPAVLLLHGCGGFDGLLAVGADRLAARGFVALALDALGPHGMTTACEGNSDGDEAGAARATLAWLRKQSYVAPDRLGVVGFSMGGDAALALIDTHGTPAPPGLHAAVVYYPSCESRDGLTDVPLTIFNGSADKVAPPQVCEAMTRKAEAAGKPVTITTYRDATHGFDVPGPDRDFFGTTVHYDPDASLDAARQTLNFLTHYLVKP